MDVAQEPHLGERLQKFREASGLSQRELVERLGRRSSYQSTIARIEQGTVRPSLELLEELAGVYKCTLDQLTKGPLPAGSEATPPEGA